MVAAGVAVGGVGAVGVARGIDLPLPPCPLRALTGIPCPGCGAGRCVTALLEGDLGGALDANALVPLALLLVVWAGVAAMAGRLGLRLGDPLRSRYASLAVAATVGGFWLLRLVPAGPGAWLAP